MRTLTKDTVNKIGESVTLLGWVHVRRDHGKLIFIDLRDRWGIVQVVFSPARKELLASANQLRSEWVVEIRGTVKKRPKNMENPVLATGLIEVEADGLNILNESKTPPFALDTDGYEIGEENRLHYRYLDLRRERLKNDLVVRDKVIAYMRDFLHKNNFIEIETPILTKSTPEGARDYVVPSRIYPGKFYALPQSPQQYKQLLMVAGIERYFQIARCFRDEDTRGDRQPEFTQLDIEMSFTDREEILAMTEKLYLSLVRTLFPDKRLTLEADGRIPVMTYKEAMEKYGTDKPDVRKDKNDKDELAFLFVVDFPAFEWKETERRWDATHHPFTKPRVENVEMFWKEFKERPGEMLADQYDFVLNGYEIGGGSIRIHDPELLKAVFEALGNAPEAVERQFGHMLEAFRYGVPPHGGIAPGIDRLVMILQNEPNIREVIAFPKTGDGRDLMMDAPSEIDKKQLKELHITIEAKPL
ncbi:MAG: aspartate--tRNA ligase [Candidatus Sungbacteria bacterium]|nr:aspartate--tRNA ligase [Candidatus Sungbacteria bacterium]